MEIAKIFLVVLVLGTALGAKDTKIKLPANGVIPDETTAVAVATAIFQPVYGKDYVDKFLPYHAQLEHDHVWVIYGTLRPAGADGGTPQLRINKQDGRVLEIWHSM